MLPKPMKDTIPKGSQRIHSPDSVDMIKVVKKTENGQLLIYKNLKILAKNGSAAGLTTFISYHN